MSSPLIAAESRSEKVSSADPVEVRDQEEQEVLVAKLGEKAVLTVAEEAALRVPDRDQRVPRAEKTGIRALVRIGPVTVVAVAPLKFDEGRFMRR